jgi:hypothetical protein
MGVNMRVAIVKLVGPSCKFILTVLPYYYKERRKNTRLQDVYDFVSSIRLFNFVSHKGTMETFV